jgi:hypothetical protein
MMLKFLALQGAPYIYDISRLRVNSFHFSERLRHGGMVKILGIYPVLTPKTVFSYERELGLMYG